MEETMARRPKQASKSNNAVLPVMRPDAAGIDIGATDFVAVPADRAEENVRSFPTFTQDLYALADWLRQCGIRTVAMESTGVYWIPLFQILEERQFEVCRVNARHVKNVLGRRTDVSLQPLRVERRGGKQAVLGPPRFHGFSMQELALRPKPFAGCASVTCPTAGAPFSITVTA
jgi:hypothetical protein